MDKTLEHLIELIILQGSSVESVRQGMIQAYDYGCLCGEIKGLNTAINAQKVPV